MSWEPQTTLRGINAAQGQPVQVKGMQVHVGDIIEISDGSRDISGKVLEIDHGAMYPIKLECSDMNRQSVHSLRIWHETFSPNEIDSIRKGYTQ